MKRRVRKILNFFAFNLLFFALYLNFIHKDNMAVAAVSDNNNQANAAAFSGTVLVENPEQYMQKKNEITIPAVEQSTTVATKEEPVTGEPLRLSIN
jgi:hypothetical protein